MQTSLHRTGMVFPGSWNHIFQEVAPPEAVSGKVIGKNCCSGERWEVNKVQTNFQALFKKFSILLSGFDTGKHEWNGLVEWREDSFLMEVNRVQCGSAASLVLILVI